MVSVVFTTAAARLAGAKGPGGGPLVEEWLAGFAASPLRVPRPFALETLRAQAENLRAELAWVFAEPDVRPGSPILREAEKRISFLGGTLASLGASGFDCVALVAALRDLLVGGAGEDERRALARLFEWFLALTLEGYASSREESLRIKHREAMERGMPVVMLTPELPAALLVGYVDRPILETTFGRLMLSIVRTGAPAIIVDAGGLVEPAGEAVLAEVAVFASHPKLAKVLVIVTGLAPDAQRAWEQALAGKAPHCFEDRFDDAVTRALASGGRQIVRR